MPTEMKKTILSATILLLILPSAGCAPSANPSPNVPRYPGKPSAPPAATIPTTAARTPSTNTSTHGADPPKKTPSSSRTTSNPSDPYSHDRLRQKTH